MLPFRSSHLNNRCRPYFLAAVILSMFNSTPAWSEPETLDVRADRGEMEKLLAKYNQLITEQPGNARLFLKRGETHFKLQEFDKAISDFTTAIKHDDHLDDAYFGRGMALGRHGQLEEGIVDIGVYIQRHPKSSLGYTKRGIRHIWNGDLDNAEKDLKKAIELDPRNAEAHDDLGVILSQRGEYQDAITHFQATIHSDPTYHKAHHNLGMVLYILSQNDHALASVQNALKLVPESRDSMLLKAAILESMGRLDEAKRAREDAEFMPAGSDIERAAVH